MRPAMMPAEAMKEKWPARPVDNDMDFAANTHIILHAGRYLTTVKAGPLTYELSSAGHRRPCDFSGILPGGLAAHAKSAPGTGELDHLGLNRPIDLARISG
jgi:carotenoid cleavage dioxygenase-like enzyme